MKPIIKVESLSKQYRLGSVGTGTLSNDLKRWWHQVRGKDDPFLKIGESNDRSTKGKSEYVWALKDINFEVMPGEILGIIGKNGAGKSTLLKILSKVTGPTTGRIDYNGRIGSLLEVGTGFHPELTGRENIFLNGAILGMTKREIRAKLDEIIDFSGCERYIDTPVKRYSSGMTVRLGFAVAAHLDPEILIVDEVLAVGDAEFQKKAIGKMQDISKGGGRTVLFVSHNMGSLRQLCTRGLLIGKGQVTCEGSIDTVIDEYLQNVSKRTEYNAPLGETEVFIRKAYFEREKQGYLFSEEVKIIVEVASKIQASNTSFSFAVVNKFDQRVFSNVYPFSCKIGNYRFSIKLPSKLLAPNHYSILLAVDIPNQILFDYVVSALSFEIIDEGSLLSKYTGHHGDIIIENNIDLVKEPKPLK
ncbi:ABC transporter ATP-binding protein [Spirosoma fluviale]|uniref:Lipopolysaccharide transport system ATP-binding protein n=1 Tax=Spirosoma fluviale TaxID=1597977 RepID=A0A286FDB0_9BACT|nr:ABC transporter ATP-binding protein [Spirosoma fluviale]SOD81192.1 lipopolysaccharide transport system ATP-binding protein [Spirosoma fluviale]